MSGYAMVYAPCLICKQVFGFNPHLVPSLRVRGVKEPICQPCVNHANKLRVEKGHDPHPIAPGAYEPIREEEL